MTKGVTGYSSAQVALHWTVVVLVAFQFLAHDGIVESWRAYLDNKQPPADDAVLTYMHIGGGMLVFILAVARLYLRFSRGVPPPPSDEPRILQITAEAVHGLIYLLLLALPISGSIAWFTGSLLAGNLHDWFKTILLAAIALHIAGGLFQHFIRRSDVLVRMFRPQSR